MDEEEKLRERHRQQAYKVVALRALQKVLRDHLGPRMMSEATDKGSATWALGSVDGFLRSWASQEKYSEDKLAQKLAFQQIPEDWKFPL